MGPLTENFWPIVSLAIFFGLSILIGVHLFMIHPSKLERAAQLPLEHSEEEKLYG